MTARLAGVCCIAWLAACASDGDGEPALPSLRPAMCLYEDDPAIRCAFLDVPEKRTDPSSPTISIFVSILPARDGSNDRPPVFVLAGGPGGTPSYGEWIDHPVREHRAIVVPHQRGVGYSEPLLHCGELATVEVTTAGRSYDDPATLDAYRAAAAACRERYRDRGVDVGAFNTTESADDIEDLRRALGVAQIDLRGASYGTQLALEVARRHPDSVRSMALFGTYPPQVDHFGNLAQNGAAAIQAVFDACEADPDCPSSDLSEEFDERMAELDENPFPLTSADGETYHLKAADIGRQLFNMLYSSSSIVEVPYVALDLEVAPAELGAPMAAELRAGDSGVFLSVSCSERYPFTDRERAMVGPRHLRGLTWNLLPHVAACPEWDVAPAPEDAVEPVRSHVPALLLVGRFDPITPPTYSRLAAETLPNAQLIELPGAGHDTQSHTPCVMSMLDAFFDDPTERVDTRCVDDELGPPNF